MPKTSPGQEYVEIRKSLGKAILHARLSRGVSAQWVAQKMGVSQGVISQWESGQRNMPGIPALVALMRALHTTITITGSSLDIGFLPGMPTDVAIEGAIRPQAGKAQASRKERSP